MAKNSDENKIDEIKIITLGNSQVGKTSIIIRFIEKKFSFNYLSTIGLDFKSKKILLPNGNEVKIRVFDTAGQDRFRSIAVSYIQKADGILLIYDITNQGSFDSVGKWISDIKAAKGDKMPIVLIGNKMDLADRVINKEMGEEKANCFNIPFFETSCKTGENVEKAFYNLIKQILNNMGEKSNTFKLRKAVGKKKEKKKCCLID